MPDSDAYNILKHEVYMFNSALKKEIRQAKMSYFDLQLERYKYDIKNTWQIIREALCKSNNSKQRATIERIVIQN